ncbi:MAG: MATE family efflux transporter [Oscillospiraceae bacterium]|jgi:putative MATE family efflux protein|nr:MATE family efflux transporter [Oscillospiraceae bacterium]
MAKKIDDGNFAVGSVRMQIMRLALPMTAAQLINLLYSIVDRMYLGRMAESGSLALTGVGLVLPIISILNSVGGLCGTGGAPLFSIARGRGDDGEAEKIMGNSFSLLMIFGVILTAGIIIFKRPILYAFGASDATYPYASQYLSIYTTGTLFVMTGLGMNPFINAQGAAKRGMLTVALGAVVNIVLDPIFIFTLHMGVRGAALATVIAQGCSAVWVLLYLTGPRSLIRLKLADLRLSARCVGRIISLGLSGFVMNLTNSLIQIVCNKTLSVYGGDLYIGVMTVINAVREIVFMPVSGVNAGATPVMGFNYGAGENGRLRAAIRFSTTVAVSYTLAIWAAIMLAPRFFIGIFSPDPMIIETGVRSMRLYFAMSAFMSLQMSAQVVFVALGKSKQAVFFSLLRKAFIAAPLTLLLPRFFGVDGVFIADTVSQIIGGLACGGTMYFTLYKRLGKETDSLRNVDI